jgi:hypothetical protein
MNKLEIILNKRTAKGILYILAECFLLPTTIFLIIYTVEEFSWYKVVFSLLFLLGVLFVGKSLLEFFAYGQIKLVVESNGKTMSFYNTNSSGKVFNKSEEIDLTKMGKFYAVKKRTRYLMNNYSYAFEEKGSRTNLFTTDIDAFPSLFESTETDRNKVLEFVKINAPEIELGYENMWQRISKNK